MYGIVIDGIPIVDLDIMMMDKGEVVKCLEAENNIKAGMIVNITPLQYRKNHILDAVKLHYSIIVYINNQYIANKHIMNDFYVNYLYYTAVKKFTP